MTTKATNEVHRDVGSGRPMLSVEPESQEIRLVEVLAGQFHDPVRCVWHTADLLDDHSTYEALSYVWGDPSVTSIITIEGEAWPVTRSLGIALRQVRRVDSGRMMWADAVCIAQDHKGHVEKMHQIRLMGRIYQGCQRVLISMGDSVEQGLEAEEVSSMFRILDKHGSNGSVTEEDLSPRFLHVLQKFMACKWQVLFKWDRLWVVQEILLSPSAIMLWGTESCSWMVLERSSWVACTQGGFPTRNRAELAVINRFVGWVRGLVIVRESDTADFCRTLVRLTGREVSIPRDRIFGLLGLVPHAQRKSLTIDDSDYDTPLAQIHYQVAVEMIFNTRSLKSFAGLIGSASRPCGSPSWAMDWASEDSIKSSCHEPNFWNHAWIHDQFAASSGRELVMSTDQEMRTISLQGVELAVVVWKHTMPDVSVAESDHVCNELFMELWNAVSAITNIESRYPGADILNREAVWRTLLSDSICTLCGDVPHRRAASSDGKIFEGFLEHGCEADSVDSCLCQSLYAYSSGHTFFVTSSGHFGVGPPNTQVGDSVWVLYGGNTPYILRSMPVYGDNDASFVGESYVHGVMEGEIIDGLEQGLAGLAEAVVTLH